MTLPECKAAIGQVVMYGRTKEHGVIVRCLGRHVFVRYTGDVGAKATSPEDLVIVAGS